MISKDVIKIHKHVKNKDSSLPICSICFSLMDCISPNMNSLSNLNEIESYPFEIFDNLIRNQITKKINVSVLPQKYQRKRIIDLLLKIKRKLNLSNKIIHLTIYLLDTIISTNQEKYNKIIEQICLGCLILSIKFLQNQAEIPDFKNFEFLFNSNVFYSLDEIKKYELFCIKQLKYNLSYITSVDYIQYFESRGIIFINDINDNMNNYINIKTFHNKIYEILIKVLYKISYTDFSPFDLAIFALCQAREFFNLQEKINKSMVIAYRISVIQYQKINEQIKQIIASPRNSIGNKSSRTDRSSLLDTANSTGNINSIFKCSSNKSLLYLEASNNSSGMSQKKNIFLNKDNSKKKRNKSVGMKLDSTDSFLNEYIKNNLLLFKNHKEKHGNNKSNHSNDSNCKKETEVSSNATPENPINNLNLPNVKKFKYKKIQDTITINSYFAIPEKKKCKKDAKIIKNLSYARNISDIFSDYKNKKSTMNENKQHHLYNGFGIKNNTHRQKRAFSNKQH